MKDGLIGEKQKQHKRVVERFHALLEASPDAIIIIDAAGQIVLVNAHTLHYFGYSRDELIGNPIEMLMPKSFQNRHLSERNQFMAEPRTRTMGAAMELYALRKDGSQFPVEIHISPIETEDGVLVVGTMRDITERKTQERQLLFHTSVQENINDAVVVTDLEFRIQGWNRAAENTYGWRADEVMGKRVGDVLQIQYEFEHEREFIIREFLRQGHWHGEFIHLHKDGSELHILGSTNRFNDEKGLPFGIVSINRDISELIEAERILRESEEQAREFQEKLKALQEISFELARTVSLEQLCRRAIELGRSGLGYDRMGMMLFENAEKSSVSKFGIESNGELRIGHGIPYTAIDQQAYSWLMNQESVRVSHDSHLNDFDSSVPVGRGWSVMSGIWDTGANIGWIAADNYFDKKPLIPYQVELLKLYGLTLGHLITRKRAEEALRESERQLRLLAQNSPDVIYIMDLAEHRATYLNRTEFLGHSQSEIEESRLLLEAIHPDDKERVFAHWRDTMLDTVPRSVRTIEYRLQDKQGKWQWVQSRETIFASAADGMPTHILVTLTLITERKQAETQALELGKERERVKILSDFIRDTSHDFRTPLTIISTSIYLLSKSPDEEKRKQYFSRADEQIRRLTRLIDRLLTMGRLDSQIIFAFQRYDLNQLVSDFCTVVNSEAREKAITVERSLSENSLMVQADLQELGTAFEELGTNAVQYTPQNGTITVRTKRQGEQAVIEIQDTGVGISGADLPFIFQRLYRADTARSAETGGSGLGLSIAKRIVELHQGTIDVESIVGKGSTFRIFLPLRK